LEKLPGYEKDHLFRCANCGFVFSCIKPSIEELNVAYSSYARDNQISEITIKRYNDLLDEFEGYRNTNNIIDVGCGDGWFLVEAKKRGWSVFGTEFEERAVVNGGAKGIIMHQGVLKPSNYSVTFDIITSFEVVEHINNPMEEFKNFYSILRPGGLVYVTTPNFNSLSRKLLGPKWNVLNYPEHLSYYTPGTLRFAFKKSGLKLRRQTTSGFSFSRYKDSKTKKKSTGKVYNKNTDENIREKMESSKLLNFAKGLVNGLFHITGTGDTIKSSFVKPE